VSELHGHGSDPAPHRHTDGEEINYFEGNREPVD